MKNKTLTQRYLDYPNIGLESSVHAAFRQYCKENAYNMTKLLSKVVADFLASREVK